MKLKNEFIGILILFAFAGLLFSGCQTAKGIGVGMSQAVYSVADGAQKDARGIFKGIMRLDEFVRKFLW